ncbi:large ribosomal subunit protein mL38 [Anopheles ziemanni]|uniref:large ribosomal subunit protein mL38 n=1 Tax=Anopheles ziemanni TaxID=345580 RepID=UPI002657DA38|nr:large ribosomal subunit protein mL38 isoform X1 [Anopheles coustani]XP_058175982.1 large ribosomal subunit protein mL38 [Anopheles ziemanni]
MAHLIQRTCEYLLLKPNVFQKFDIRCGHRLRGRAPGIAKTLRERLEEESAVDPDISKPVNIGFPALKPSRSTQLSERLEQLKAQRSNPELERQSRERKLNVNLDQVREDWLKTSGPFHIKRIAEHYGVFKHLFGSAYFVPRVELKIEYTLKDTIHPVRYGNILKPSETQNAPSVQFDGRFNLSSDGKTQAKEQFWCLLMTNPDMNVEGSEKEHCHWFVGNIPNGDVSKGDLVMPYLQPFPPKGTGYHRHIFVLYKQESRMDFSQYQQTETYFLPGRSFRTLDFYRQHQDSITPAGLALFQSDWDTSLPAFYQEKLQMQHPVYEYDFPAPYIRDQEWFPQRKPFNLYMDKYRDPAQIRKEYLVRKLAKTHPFEGPEKPLRFPNAHSVGKEVPSWLRTEIKKSRLGWGRINDI